MSEATYRKVEIKFRKVWKRNRGSFGFLVVKAIDDNKYNLLIINGAKEINYRNRNNKIYNSANQGVIIEAFDQDGMMRNCAVVSIGIGCIEQFVKDVTDKVIEKDRFHEFEAKAAEKYKNYLNSLNEEQRQFIQNAMKQLNCQMKATGSEEEIRALSVRRFVYNKHGYEIDLNDPGKPYHQTETENGIAFRATPLKETRDVMENEIEEMLKLLKIKNNSMT